MDIKNIKNIFKSAQTKAKAKSGHLKSVRGVSDVDKNIGQQIYSLRLARGWTREKLGDQIGVTLQQVQKYEIGTNRISASRLALVAKIMNQPIEYFYKNTDSEVEIVNTEHQRMCIEVSRNFMNIKNSAYQEVIHTLAKTLASGE